MEGGVGPDPSLESSHARDPHPPDRRPSPTPRTGLPPGHRPQAPGPLANRPTGPPGLTPPAHRRRPGHHHPHRPELAQRLPAGRPGRPEAPQGQGAAPGHPGPPGRDRPALGHRRAGQSGARQGQLDPRRAGRPPRQDPRRCGQSLDHAAPLPQDRHPAQAQLALLRGFGGV